MRIPTKKKPERVQGFRGRRSSDMRMFFRSSPWAEWWDKFYMTYGSDGLYRYRTVRGLVKEIAESKEQADFLLWRLGPPVPEGETDHRQADYPYATGGPQHWQEKRRTGGWFSRETMSKAFPEWNRRLNALEALRETGRFTSKDLVRYEEMQRQVDEEFNGHFLIPGQKIEASATRARLYLSLTEAIDQLKEKAHARHRASLGINLEDISGLVQIMSATAMQSDKTDGVSMALHGLVKSVMAKSQRLSLPLPTGAEDVIIEAQVESVKKKNLN